MGLIKNQAIIRREQEDPMALEHLSDEELVEGIQEWAGDHPDFDTTFVDELSEKLEKYGELTENQRNALCNIALKWKMDL